MLRPGYSCCQAGKGGEGHFRAQGDGEPFRPQLQSIEARANRARHSLRKHKNSRELRHGATGHGLGHLAATCSLDRFGPGGL